jgi:hypothetical protein
MRFHSQKKEEKMKLKFLLAAALVTLSGAAMAEMVQPVYNPASVYNPATGQYESGCGAIHYWSFTGGGQTDIPAMLNGGSTQFYNSGSLITVSCSSGTNYASGEAYQGDLYI